MSQQEMILWLLRFSREMEKVYPPLKNNEQYQELKSELVTAMDVTEKEVAEIIDKLKRPA